MKKPFLVVVLLLLLAPGLAGATATRAPGPGAATGTDGYWKYDGNGGTDAVHYNIKVAYDFSRRSLRGRTVVTMRALKDLRSFTLDLLLPVSSVAVDGRRARFSAPHAHELRVVPARAIARGSIFRVDVRYAGRPDRYRYAGERNWLADRHEVVTMNQPHMAPWWFPSNDHPIDKARYDIRVTVPRSKRVISNGVQVSRTVRGRKAVTHWRMDDPMATYLAFFAAGDFIVENGRTAKGIRYHYAVSSQLSRAERRHSMRMLRRTAGMTDWLQGWLGRYPFTSTGGVVTNLGVGFALENQTKPTYGSWIYPEVIVHELAHQWFGDSVSVQRWRDIWLNEGFATFAEVAWGAARGGESVRTWLRGMYEAWCTAPLQAFWKVDLRNPGRARIFHQAVYERGAMVVAALQGRVGEPALREVLRAWVNEHHDGNATVAQFEAFAADHTGADLDGFFDAWLSGDGVPAATVDNGLDPSWSC